MENKLSYEVRKGIKVEDLLKIIEYFDADCKWEHKFYCSETTRPIYKPVITHSIVFNFTFPFEIDKGFALTFFDLLLSIDIWEAREDNE